VTPSFAIAFVAGLLSFLSPCTLPLIPSYVGFLTGLSADELEVRRGTALLHALAFVAGFSGIFIALGVGKKPANWVYLSPLLPLALLAFTGLYMFVLPYAAKWRSKRHPVAYE